jgi:hypothetical protein
MSSPGFYLEMIGESRQYDYDENTMTWVPKAHSAGASEGPATTVDQGAPGSSAWPVSVSGVSTSAKQDTGNTSLASIDGKLPALSGGRVPVELPTGGGGLTDTELRASAVPVSVASLPLPSTASTGAKQDTGNTSLGNIDTKTPALGQALAAASTPVVLPAAQITALTPPAAITGYATETTLGTRLTESDFDAKVGSLTEGAPATDTASSGLNGRLQRVAQRLTSLLALLPAALGAGGGLKVDGSGTALPVSGTVTANAGTGPFPVSDNGGTLTVDAPVGTPAFVRLSDGAAAIATLPVSAATLPLPSNASQETGGNLATLAAKDFATGANQSAEIVLLATIATDVATLVTAPGAAATSVVGPMVQAIVSDTPESFVADTIRPLSLTSEGRLRVSMVPADIDRVWNDVFDNPWSGADTRSAADAGVNYV